MMRRRDSVRSKPLHDSPTGSRGVKLGFQRRMCGVNPHAPFAAPVDSRCRTLIVTTVTRHVVADTPSTASSALEACLCILVITYGGL